MTQTAAAPRPPEAAVPLLEARALTKHFAVHHPGRAVRRQAAGGRRRGPAPAVHAVEEVSLTLPQAGITAVVGESGSGKSTLARMLARLITPTSGKLLLDGAEVPVVTRGRRAYARDVQLVLQDPFSSLNPVHGVRYHLERPLRLHGLNGQGASLEEAMTGLLERVALTPAEQFLSKYPHELSGGQRQRVAIARALAVRPRVLLADEPVSMLDVSIRLGVLNLLGDLRERDGLAILYITHDIASARYLAEAIMVMYAGQVVESGPAEVVTDSPAHPYTKLLLSAAPDPDRAEPPSLAGSGAPPSLVAPPGGCRFHPRCPHAMAVCAVSSPPGTELAAGHVSACWLHATGLDAAQAQPLAAADELKSSAPSSAPEGGEET
ncbi:MAG TPA: ABC transporter ATP-binding protein [Streptosporangiaceae bacterium]|nr:ABC transporter ATP-binding protein [Streptosporangiaceae bacterium]